MAHIHSSTPELCLLCPQLSIRIQKLHRLILGDGVPLAKESIRKDSWLGKSFAVLLKRKKRRGKQSSNEAFQHLLSLLDGEAG